MTSASLASLLTLFAGTLMCGALVGCGGSQGGSSPTPIVADSPVAAACLAHMHSSCEINLEACAADDTCSSFTTTCLNGTDPAGAIECMSAAQGKVETDLFMCLVTADAPCYASQVDGQDGGLHGD
jgi:hypothetical protein